jgi:hypothetical protein
MSLLIEPVTTGQQKAPMALIDHEAHPNTKNGGNQRTAGLIASQGNNQAINRDQSPSPGFGEK